MKKKVFVFLSFFIGSLLLVLLSFVFLNLFQIKRVIIIGEYPNICGLEILNEQNLFFLEEEKIKENLIKRNPALSSISIMKKYPNQAVVELHFREPVAQVFSNSAKLYLDKDGVAFPAIKSELILPTIEASNISLLDEENPDWRIIKTTSLLHDLIKQSIFVERILIDDQTSVFLVYLSGGSQVIIPYTSLASKVAASLQTIVLRFRIEGKFIKKIDFRFDKPVVILSNGEKISSP